MLPVFKLENYLSQWEFKAPYLFCCSDLEAFSLRELLTYADSEGQKLWDNLSLGYTEDRGTPVLREEIRKLYPGATEDHVLTFSGAQEGIYCFFQTLLSAGDHVIVVVPCYQSLESVPATIGCEVSRVALKEENGWKLDLNEIRKAVRKSTKLIVINFPHNPTGATLDLNTLNGLIEIARQNGIYLFSDEVYRLTELDEKRSVPPVASLYEKGMSLSVMSKAYGLAGLRIGWVVSRNQSLLEHAKQTKHYLSICGSAPSEALSFIALRASEKLLKRNREILRKNLQLLDSFFASEKHTLQWVPPTGGCVALPRLLLDHPIEKFAAQLVQETGVLILPASVFDMTSNHFRIGFGRRNMPEALLRFSDFLKNNVHSPQDL